MTIDEMIAVLQARKEGKEIECKSCEGSTWTVTCAQRFAFDCYDYRVKPEPREWTVYACADGNIYSGSTTCRANPIKVREVI